MPETGQSQLPDGKVPVAQDNGLPLARRSTLWEVINLGYSIILTSGLFPQRALQDLVYRDRRQVNAPATTNPGVLEGLPSNVATAIAMYPIDRPFERPPVEAAPWTAIPRGLQSFIVELGALDLQPVNDTQTLVLTGTLGANFAYVFVEIGLRLAQDRGSQKYDFQTTESADGSGNGSWSSDVGSAVDWGEIAGIHAPRAPEVIDWGEIASIHQFLGNSISSPQITD